MSRHDKLLAAVAQPGDTAEQLAARLTVEAFGWRAGLEREVVAFRKLRHVDRVRAARRFLASHRVLSPVDLAVQEVTAAYAEELRAHVALARVDRNGPGYPRAVTTWSEAKHAHAAALHRLRRVLEDEWHAAHP